MLPNPQSELWSKPIPVPPTPRSITPFATDLPCEGMENERRHLLGGAGANMKRGPKPFATEDDNLEMYREAINRRSFNDQAGTAHVAR